MQHSSSHTPSARLANNGLELVYRDERARRGDNEEVLPQPSPPGRRDPLYVSDEERRYLAELSAYVPDRAEHAKLAWQHAER